MIIDIAVLQFALTAFLGLLSIVGGLVVNRMWKKMDDLDKADQDTNDKIFKLGVSIPTKYVSKEELYKLVDRLFDELKSINGKLDSKKDKD